MRLHILGIGGTFMAALACIARELGHEVTGSDEGVHPPMSDVLEAAGIAVREGYRAEHLQPAPDQVIVGNALTRGNPAVEYMLNEGLDRVSGPDWLARNVLLGRHVIAIAGTHGKTTVASLTAWILEQAGLNPGWLIGGVAPDLEVPGKLGTGRPFVIEADEYDTAFFDKRSKFVHYRPRILVINNLEYDHADIFDDLAAIERQFHHVVRIVPSQGYVVAGGGEAVERVLAMGCWTPVVRINDAGTPPGADAALFARALAPDGSRFEVVARGGDADETLEIEWPLIGAHNLHNAVAAIAAARAAGVMLETAAAALTSFRGAKKRLEIIGTAREITLWDDFAHHPTAIRATLEALRSRVGARNRIIAVIEPRSNTMRMGVHRDTLAASLEEADAVIGLDPDGHAWPSADALGSNVRLHPEVAPLIEDVASSARPGDHVLIMSNGSFDNMQPRLLARLESRERR